MLERKMGNAKGFTLLELMIVIAIIGILAAIAIPMYRAQTCRAKLTEVTNAMGVIASAVTVYYNVNGTLPPDKMGYKELRDDLGVNVDPRVLTRILGRRSVWWQPTMRGKGGYIRVKLAEANRSDRSLSGCPKSVLGKKIVLSIDNAPLKSGDPIRWDWDKTQSTIPDSYLPRR